MGNSGLNGAARIVASERGNQKGFHEEFGRFRSEFGSRVHSLVQRLFTPARWKA